ncbi:MULTISPECIES: helix-turn-helix transcriptional regulator [unclassified Cryobacterium]|uniref:helix-turn-helix domain-containing protein n=1 Tax=unclassified Cryobacterium TaxID=2649013 RepID=UPI002AB4ABAB|nr:MULTISPECIES: helix-turn-helix transcriptional regulator [unclassified Cryobacterium]MDY7542582.1 helix-turn-helix transcriptional regulator [Cryobacterium sp. 5B3]MEB0264702.1 helix-turn-helix transcriptional regulator [Cryobacterium sp. 10I5]MEB0273674.1 helix-turn-helix transcriptional regulator [Cryobacterium sp. 5B3]
MEKRQRRLLVADSVRAEIARQGWTRERLAESLDTPLASLERKLSGDTAIDVDTLDEIAAALGVAVDSLLGSE